MKLTPERAKEINKDMVTEDQMSEEKRPVSVVLAGAGGYGANIGGNILDHLEDYGVLLSGVVEPFYDASPLKERLEALGVPHFDSLEDFYREHSAELAVLCTPIQFHEAHAVCCMEHGSHVLLEKPTAALVSQSDHMQEVSERTGKTLNIGFQLSYMSAIHRLKEDILAGHLGAPKSAWSLVLWPRNAAYYARPWAGRRMRDGQYVLDSIAMNACAHHLHILFFLLGERMDRSLQPEKEEVKFLRANDIETFDTAMMRIQAGNVFVHFLVSHTVPEEQSPVMKLHFEHADVFIQGESSEEDAVQVRFHDGRIVNYGGLQQEYHRKIPYVLDVVRGLKAPVCTPVTARAHLLSVSEATLKAPVLDLRGGNSGAVSVGQDSGGVSVYLENDVRVVAGLAGLLRQAYEEEKMPWELTEVYGAPEIIELIREQKQAINKKV